MLTFIPLSVRRVLASALTIGVLAVRAGAQAAPASSGTATVPAPAAATQATGRISGTIVDKATGRPLASAQVGVIGTTGGATSDLDGRFRSPPVPIGLRTLEVHLIGYKPIRLDSIRVTTGQTVTVTAALTALPAAQLQSIVIAGEEPTRANSTVGLLAVQQAAIAVVTGVSAEAISRTPDSDAGQAITRVPGLSVVQDKVVVRGLTERYSSSLLNGVEIASPEPDKKFVPLDIFAASLIESIIASKTATPDKPGDFAGGLVDVQTKEFPENFVFSFGFSQGYNSRSTFKPFARPPRSGLDYLGLDARSRGINDSASVSERAAESLSNVWTPRPERARPAVGGDLSIGGRKDFAQDVFGYIFSVNYNTGRDYNPDRIDASGEAPFRIAEANEHVDLGGIFNLAYRLGGSHKFGFKNFYSRGSNELVRNSLGGDSGDGPSLNYQVDFVEQAVEQSQLTGDHSLPWLLDSRIEWKASVGEATRNDLDNRQLRYFDVGNGFTAGGARPSYRYNAALVDKSSTGQLDWSIPFWVLSSAQSMFKFGGLYRRKDRDFATESLELKLGSALPQDARELPPEQLLAPENLGPDLIYYDAAGTLTPYVGREEVRAGYTMLDYKPFSALRIVVGVRWERWNASLTEAAGRPRPYETANWLWSTNVSIALTETANLRLAAYETVARPDLRELSRGGYAADVGGLPVVGDTTLTPSNVRSADVRYEIYPSSDELFAVSVFAKEFDRPLLVVRRDAGGTVISPVNGDRATSLGAELEFRKHLGFLGGWAQPILLNGNLTLLRSRIRMPVALGTYDPTLPFQGQSPYLVNFGLTYGRDDARASVSFLFNRFGDRITQYGTAGTSGQTGERHQGYNVVERARAALDAKIKLALRKHWSLSLSGKNLLDARSELAADEAVAGRTLILGRSLPGVSLSTGFSYAF